MRREAKQKRPWGRVRARGPVSVLVVPVPCSRRLGIAEHSLRIVVEAGDRVLSLRSTCPTDDASGTLGHLDVACCAVTLVTFREALKASGYWRANERLKLALPHSIADVLVALVSEAKGGEVRGGEDRLASAEARAVGKRLTHQLRRANPAFSSFRIDNSTAANSKNWYLWHSSSALLAVRYGAAGGWERTRDAQDMKEAALAFTGKECHCCKKKFKHDGRQTLHAKSPLHQERFAASVEQAVRWLNAMRTPQKIQTHLDAQITAHARAHREFVAGAKEMSL